MLNKYQILVYPKVHLDVYAENIDEAESIAEEELKDILEGFEFKIENMDTQEITKGDVE